VARKKKKKKGGKDDLPPKIYGGLQNGWPNGATRVAELFWGREKEGGKGEEGERGHRPGCAVIPPLFLTGSFMDFSFGPLKHLAQ